MHPSSIEMTDEYMGEIEMQLDVSFYHAKYFKYFIESFPFSEGRLTVHQKLFWVTVLIKEGLHYL